jgi:hypothetical protein
MAANPATQAGMNGVSGAAAGTQAWRKSVSCTEGGTYSQSDVKSVTNNLRFAYKVADCDSPPDQR